MEVFGTLRHDVIKIKNVPFHPGYLIYVIFNPTWGANIIRWGVLAR